MIRTLACAALFIALPFCGSARADETDASNHGYNTAALEVVCGDALTVTNPKLRAKLDRAYRESPRWRRVFLDGYAGVASRGGGTSPLMLMLTCTNAAASGWLKLDPGARDQLEIGAQASEAERRERRR